MGHLCTNVLGIYSLMGKAFMGFNGWDSLMGKAFMG